MCLNLKRYMLMSVKKTSEQRILEVSLILICVALCCLLYRVGPYRMVVLNLFYLPVVLAAFFLGRYLAGVLTLLCVVCAATVVTALDLGTLASYTSPLAVGLALTIWAAVMGINAILVGTLSDERLAKIQELHDAYLGVVEVLVQYLNSAEPRRCRRARKIAEISQRVAARMKFSDREIDDIRVAALLQDMDHIEVTATRHPQGRGRGRSPARRAPEHTFHGSDLVQAWLGAHGGAAAAGRPRRGLDLEGGDVHCSVRRCVPGDAGHPHGPQLPEPAEPGRQHRRRPRRDRRAQGRRRRRPLRRRRTGIGTGRAPFGVVVPGIRSLPPCEVGWDKVARVMVGLPKPIMPRPGPRAVGRPPTGRLLVPPHNSKPARVSHQPRGQQHRARAAWRPGRSAGPSASGSRLRPRPARRSAAMPSAPVRGGAWKGCSRTLPTKPPGR